MACGQLLEGFWFSGLLLRHWLAPQVFLCWEIPNADGTRRAEGGETTCGAAVGKVGSGGGRGENGWAILKEAGDRFM